MENLEEVRYQKRFAIYILQNRVRARNLDQTNGLPQEKLYQGSVGISEEFTSFDLDEIDLDDITDWCERGEDQYIEFKDQAILSNKVGRKKLLQRIAGFANSNRARVRTRDQNPTDE